MHLLCNRSTAAVQSFLVGDEMYRTQVYWPLVVDNQLDELVGSARAAGERTSRAELLAALVWHASTDGEGLGVMVRTYRREVDRKRGAGVAKRRRPGPLPRSTAE
jgi:hypothetical protein